MFQELTLMLLKKITHNTLILPVVQTLIAITTNITGINVAEEVYLLLYTELIIIFKDFAVEQHIVDLADGAATIAAIKQLYIMANEAKNSVVAAAEATTENVNVANAQQVETIDAIIARICKDGKSKVVKTAITAIDCEERTSKTSTKYINAFVNLETPVIGSQKLADGTYRMGLLGAIQFPFNSLLLVMRKHRFYGKFVHSIEEAATINMVADYLAGVEISVFCQFVAAGEVARNPFTRNATEYDVADHDRYIYHVVGIELPTDPIVLEEYKHLIAQQRQARIDAIAAAKAAKASAVSLLATATAADDMPF